MSSFSWDLKKVLKTQASDINEQSPQHQDSVSLGAPQAQFGNGTIHGRMIVLAYILEPLSIYENLLL